MKHWFKIVLKLYKTKTAINEEFQWQNSNIKREIINWKG